MAIQPLGVGTGFNNPESPDGRVVGSRYRSSTIRPRARVCTQLVVAFDWA